MPSRATLDAVKLALDSKRAEASCLPCIDEKKRNLNNSARNYRSTCTLQDREKEAWKTQRRQIPANTIFKNMIQEGEIPFQRSRKSNVFNKPPQNTSCSQFNLRINKNYDPAKRFEKSGNLSKWDTSKHQLLEYLNSNRSKVRNNEDLVYNIDTVNYKTDLSRKFPELSGLMARPHKYVPNDAHIKETAPGFARNDYGKPFFS